MTIELQKGKATVPLWSVIVIIVSVLMAGGGIIWGALAESKTRQLMDLSENLSTMHKEITANREKNAAQDLKDIALEQGIVRLQEGQERMMRTLDRIERKLWP